MSAEQQVEELIRGPQYARAQTDKEALLAPLLCGLCRDVALRCPPYARFLERLGRDAASWRTMLDIPPLPAAMFKRFLLSAVPPEQVVRQLQSSATTGQQPSRIVVDKTTAFRQSRALVSILKEHIGPQRRPLLVLDAPQSVAEGESLTARGAAVRGLQNFAAETVFAMQPSASGDLEPDWGQVQDFQARHAQRPVLVFGFTFVVWTRLVVEAQRRGLRFALPGAILLHSGGWKRLTAEAVSKQEFTRQAALVLGCRPEAILDFYGMVEQVGTVFVDCEAGNKHAPAFADVLLRRPGSLEPAQIGESGLIEVLSALPTSFPGQAILTEDEGLLVGVDDCLCGRKGRYFRFLRRVEQTEPRGCGDTFGQGNKREAHL